MYFYWINAFIAPTLTATLLIFCFLTLSESWRVKKGGSAVKWPRMLFVALFFGYLSGLLSITLDLPELLRQGIRMDGDFNLVPFKQISGFLNYMESEHTSVNLWGNIFIFTPIGFLYPLLWRRRHPILAGAVFTLLLSVFIEAFQFFTPRVTDIDDVILNTLGGFIGSLLCAVFRRLFPAAARRIKRPLERPAP